MMAFETEPLVIRLKRVLEDIGLDLLEENFFPDSLKASLESHGISTEQESLLTTDRQHVRAVLIFAPGDDVEADPSQAAVTIEKTLKKNRKKIDFRMLSYRSLNLPEWKGPQIPLLLVFWSAEKSTLESLLSGKSLLPEYIRQISNSKVYANSSLHTLDDGEENPVYAMATEWRRWNDFLYRPVGKGGSLLKRKLFMMTEQSRIRLFMFAGNELSEEYVLAMFHALRYSRDMLDAHCRQLSLAPPESTFSLSLRLLPEGVCSFIPYGMNVMVYRKNRERIILTADMKGRKARKITFRLGHGDRMFVLPGPLVSHEEAEICKMLTEKADYDTALENWLTGRRMGRGLLIEGMIEA